MVNNSKMIPRSEWKYRGIPGHLCVVRHCYFRLCTDIGQLRVSTVGAYYPPSKDGGHMEEIGCERHYETMVFRINSDGSVDFTELMIRGIEFKMNEGEDYRDAAERHDRLAEEMHDQVCQHVATNHADVLRGGAE